MNQTYLIKSKLKFSFWNALLFLLFYDNKFIMEIFMRLSVSGQSMSDK